MEKLPYVSLRDKEQQFSAAGRIEKSCTKYSFLSVSSKLRKVNKVESTMKKMRKYSGATGLKAVPNIPTTFVPRGSPHFVAALSGKGQDYSLRKTSVYKNDPYTNQLKKHSTVCRPNLPIIQVTMGEKEDRDAWNVQRKVSSSFAPTRVELGSLEISERCNTASQANEKQRKTSAKERIVVGETPLGKDVLFRRKISNTATPKITKAEEKERLLMKYTPLNNETMNVGQYNKKQIKNLYFSRYNISMEVTKTAEVLPSLSKESKTRGTILSDWIARGRTQSLNFDSGKAEARKKAFRGDPSADANSRDRAQSLNFEIRRYESTAGSTKIRQPKDRKKGLRDITRELRKQNSPHDTAETKESAIKVNGLPSSLLVPFSQSAIVVNTFEGKLSPVRDKLHIKPSRKESQDRNAFLTFPSLRGTSWTGDL